MKFVRYVGPPWKVTMPYLIGRGQMSFEGRKNINAEKPCKPDRCKTNAGLEESTLLKIRTL